ncbi:hypothetical protein FB451DRAFT_1522580 [Mycena latifolia]|nr:hypothetical protein FB451DRAFT_1522580 [Mycena latifolia]
MFSSTSLLATCMVAMSGLVVATPAPRQVQCNPNFEGAGVSIVDVNIDWQATPPVAGTLLTLSGDGPVNRTAEWHVEQTGATPTTYIIKEISHNNLVVDISADGLLTLEEIDSSKPTQIWEIICGQCLPGASSTPGGGEFANACRIVSPPSGACVQLEPGVNLGIDECKGTAIQRFAFWTATA